MGNKAGWLTLYAGVAGGADIILLPEIPYDIEKVCQAVEKRRKQGKAFSIVTIAEGALSRDEAALPKKELKAALESRTVPVSYRDKRGDARRGAGTHTAWRLSVGLRPRAIHEVRRVRGGTH
jgi:6-phosphofructokinase